MSRLLSRSFSSSSPYCLSPPSYKDRYVIGVVGDLARRIGGVVSQSVQAMQHEGEHGDEKVAGL